jgi:CRISPR-associated protein Csx10
MRIRMELLSDALAGSGEALAGTVDRDIAFDERGLPFIPAKRIRGVLRESMNELEFLGLAETGTTEALFGVPGTSASSPFRIHDGRVENAEALASFLDSAKKKNELAAIFSPRIVLDWFSYLRAQPTVEDGVAKENTLKSSLREY